MCGRFVLLTNLRTVAESFDIRTIAGEYRTGDNMKLFEVIVDEEQVHYNYFDNVSEPLKKLGAAYLAQIAGTPADTGPPSNGFVIGQAGQ